jgi:hypothetical protein
MDTTTPTRPAALKHVCRECREPEGILHRPGCVVVMDAGLTHGFVRRDECEAVPCVITIRDALGHATGQRWPDRDERVYHVTLSIGGRDRSCFAFGRSKRTAVARAVRWMDADSADVARTREVPADALDTDAREWAEARP